MSENFEYYQPKIQTRLRKHPSICTSKLYLSKYFQWLHPTTGDIILPVVGVYECEREQKNTRIKTVELRTVKCVYLKKQKHDHFSQ